MAMKKIKPPTSDISTLDVGLDGDQELGATVADAKIAAMQQGFDDPYQKGVTKFFQQQCGEKWESDRWLGAQIASARLEERRRTLLTIAIKTSIFTGVSGLAALMVGVPPAQGAIVFIPSTLAAICTSKKR